MSEATQHTTRETLDWYRTIGEKNPPFDPDGMCLAICRTARNIAARWPSAVTAQINTPTQYRVEKISNIRRGMVAFFDDPHDSNPFGHVVSVVGRIPDADPDSLRDIIVETNSAVANRIVKVRADYFGKHWGDQFQFAATYLNGEPFYDLQPDHSEPWKPKKRKYPNIEDTLNSIDEGLDAIEGAIKYHTKENHPRFVKALKRDRDKMVATKKALKATYKKFR